ncbi:putative DNA-directed RNA polymerase I subunit rpa1-like [Capsicum annuum]|nr:putative DNA-directed RNA polymerase I subunit rpa1-like [Capsicum annuum]
MMDNDFTESFNSWIVEPRGKPILKMLEEIRVKIMNRLKEKEIKVSKWKENFSPKCMKLFTANKKIAQFYTVNFNGDIGYEVSESEDRHIVTLVEKKCTCRSWQLIGIPCPHAIKAMEYNKMKPSLMKKEISVWYSKKAYLKIYKVKLLPVRGENFWKILLEHAMDPPDLVKTVGRPKFKRIREKDVAIKRAEEWAHSRKGTQKTCNEQGARLKRRKGGIEKEEEVQDDVYDINSSAPQPTQEGEDQRYEPFGPSSELESDPDLRPKIVPEDTRFLVTQNLKISAACGRRLIGFRGDLAGFSEPIDFPYSPSKLTWKGKKAITSNQLKNAREMKLGKLKDKKANGRAQI